MSASALDVLTLLVPNPDYPQNAQDVGPLPANISYRQSFGGPITTLSTNSASNGDVIKGLLYVPDIVNNSACGDELNGLIPHNATHRTNLPSRDYDLIAFAPWLSSSCTLAFLNAVTNDHVKAFIFFLSNHSPSAPPAPNDQTWGLQDGGQWKSQHDFPVYAISGSSGDQLITALSRYSGNLSSVQNGATLAQQYDVRDFVRLYAEISTGKRFTLPTLWAFLLIVLGVLIFIIGATSFCMHYVQYRRRHLLRRRIENGEVDVEALYPKPLTVPQERLQGFPCFVYVEEVGSVQDTVSHQTGTSAADITKEARDIDPGIQMEYLPGSNIATSDKNQPEIRTEQPSIGGHISPPLPPSPILQKSNLFHSRPKDVQDGGPNQVVPQRSFPYSQATCSICIEDFISTQSVVRELTCGHIFHPECIDRFLLRRSSKCPICKTSLLPPGYCPPQVTNIMVQRERRIRRLRSRVTIDGEVPTLPYNPEPSESRRAAAGERLLHSAGMMSSWVRSLWRREDGSGRVPAASGVQGSEMAEIASPTIPDANGTGPTAPLASGSVGAENGESARRGVNASPQHRQLVEEEGLRDLDRSEERNSSRWRRAASAIFPGFR